MYFRYNILVSLAVLLTGLLGLIRNQQPLFENSLLYQEPDSVVALTLYEQARVYFRVNNYEKAFDTGTESLQYAMRAGQEDTELNVLGLLAEISVAEGNPGDAIPYRLRAAGILEGRQDTAAWREQSLQLAGLYAGEEVFEKAGEYYRLAYELIPPDEFAGKYRLMEKIGLAAMNNRMPDSAAVCFREMIAIAGNAGADDTRAYIHLAAASNAAGDYSEAYRANGILEKRMRERGDMKEVSAIRNNMGYNQTRLKNYPLALENYQEAIITAETAGVPPGELALLYTNTATCLQNMGDRTGATGRFRESVRLLEEAGAPGEKSGVENMMALVYYHDGDLYNAGAMSRQAIESALEAGDADRASEAYLTYSRVLREGNDPIQALEYYEKYLTLRDSLQLERKMQEQQLAGRKYELEKSEKELKLRLKEEEVRKLAIQQLTLQLETEEQEKELLMREKDLEMLEKERLRQSLELESQRFEVERQERANQLLEQENRIKDLRLQQEEQKQKEQEQEIALLEQQKQLDQMELERQKSTRKAMIMIIVLVALAAISILGGLISSRRKNILLAKQKEEIEEKNTDLQQKNEEISAQRDEIEAQRNMLMDQKERIQEIHSEITKSIEYARRIQSSTLPGTEGLTAMFRDHFLYFRPRDIVSGDFYWLASLENTTVLTVVDCTGHGVPGAFMSMLGMSLLKEIVVKEYITQPAVILRRMRKEVITALSQKGAAGEQRDGMDMSLITIHHDNGLMEYAGANNSLYLVRRKDLPPPPVFKGQAMVNEENGDTLYEIPADKMPIAMYERMDRFTNNEITLQEDDRVYLFTDGYADQFGGPDGRKFMYRPFKRMILANSQLNMRAQFEALSGEMDKWKGDFEQIDDICVLGVKI